MQTSNGRQCACKSYFCPRYGVVKMVHCEQSAIQREQNGFIYLGAGATLYSKSVYAFATGSCWRGCPSVKAHVAVLQSEYNKSHGANLLLEMV